MSGIEPNRGVPFGASSHVARFLLTAREYDPTLRFAVNCRFDDRVEAALSVLGGPVAEFDRAAEPEPVKARESTMMQWAVRTVFEGETDPVAVVDRGEVGEEAIAKLLAPDASTLVDRVAAVHDAL